MKKLKQFAVLLLAVCLTALLTLTAAGAYSRSVYILVNGVPLDSAEAYVNENGVTMVPLRAVAEALGLTVSWNQESHTVSIVSEYAEEHRPVVMLDPGHGGSSPGAVYSGVKEKDLNLAIARKTREALEEAGVMVLMTRTDDRDVELLERTELAAGWCADLFVSIHCNAKADDDPNDIMGIYTCARGKNSDGWEMADTLRQTMIAATGAENVGTFERPNLAVLRTAVMPAALVECGYMSTPAELSLLVQPAYQEKLARGIADGILETLDRDFDWRPAAEPDNTAETPEQNA
ncbi:MAG: N-acetylmuramoyl-L-alanine amidase [Oscillospiraceae bacterium]|nr:N-acetylmuramoyl-L-alanine amidase [Oscillospiraceae bacterium]